MTFNSSYWVKRHQEGYGKAGWRDKPSPFARFARGYMPDEGLLLELGAGIGQDGIWFAENNFAVTLTELGEAGLTIAKETTRSKKLKNIKIVKLDMAKPYPFPDNYFDVVYAHSCIQYFTKKETKNIFKEIDRVLKPGGILAVLVNSVNDLEYGKGPRISDNYFKIKGLRKRYFTIEEIKEYIKKDFRTVVLDYRGESYKDQEVDNHDMIRLVVAKGN